MARALEHERGGDPLAAARVLAAALPDYPQDYEIALRLAQLYAAARRPGDAERLYRDALQRSSGAGEAALGLAWLLLVQQRCGEALPLFQAVLRHRPEHPEAAAGARACREVYPLQANLGVALGAQLFPGVSSDVRAPSVAVAARLDLRLAERVTLGIGYRARVNTDTFTDQSGQALRGQHELYVDVGYHAPRAGFTLRYAFLGEQGGATDRVHHAGLSARVSPYGDGTLDLAGSFYPDLSVVRGALAWYLPIRLGLGLTPGIAGQYASAANAPTPLLSGSLTASLLRPRFSLWLGAKYGNELRPAYLDLGIINNLPESIRFGAWAGGSVTLGRPGARGAYTLRMSYALDYLEPLRADTVAMICVPRPVFPPPPPGAPPPMICTPAPGSNSVSGFTHAITLGLTRSF